MDKKEGVEFLREYFAAQGSKGGKQRNENLTPKRRKAIAKKAAKARWAGREVAK